jgi:putative ABC transport system permease protein
MTLPERLYRGLLLSYPAEFRHEYGPEMVELFRVRFTHEKPFLLWLELLADIAITAPQEHFDVLLQDLRYALRTFSKTPVFALTAILTLALGIGANTAIFSVVHAVALRPLPFPEPDRLVRLWEMNRKLNILRFSTSVPNYVSWKEQARSFEALGVFGFASLNITGSGEPERVEAGTLTSSVFQVLRLRPLLGRGFLPEEETPGQSRVAILSESLWRRRFAGDPRIVGRSVDLNGVPMKIVGVVSPEFQFPQNGQVWVPMVMDLAHQDLGDRAIETRGHAGAGGYRDEIHRGHARENLSRQQPGLECAHSEVLRLDCAGRNSHCLDGPAGSGGSGASHRMRERSQPAARASGGAEP